MPDAIPYNYGKYIDDQMKIKDTGTIDSDQQIASPSSAGSRGLAQTTQFTNDKTQMQLGQEAIAESMVEIRSILNRIDGVNVPVQELDLKDLKPKASDVITYGKGGSLKYIQIEYEILGTLENMLINNSEQEVLKRIADFVTDEVGEEHVDKAMEIIQKAKDNDDGEMTFDDMINQLKSKGESAVQEAESDYLYLRGKEIDQGSIMYKMEDYSDGIFELQSAKYADGTELDEKELEELESTQELIDWVMIDFVSESAVKEDDMRDMTISDLEAQLGKINDEITFLQIDQKDKESALAALGELRSVLDKYQSQKESAVQEDSGELARLKELSGIEAPKESEETVSEDIDERGRIALEKAGFDPMKVKEYMAVFNDHGDTSDIDQMNMDKVGLADAMAMVLASHDVENESYQPMPEGDEFDIEEDEDFEEVLGPLGFPEDETELFDAEYQGRKVPLNKPMRGDSKKFKVYVKDPKTGNVKKVNFGHGGTSAKRKTMRIRKSNPKARKSFRARHNCANPGPKTKARYWSCRKW